jgi:hypothetical protein
MATQRVAPATMVTGGKYGTSSDTNNQVRQVDGRLIRVFPNDTPFLAITNQMTTGEEGKAMKFEWGEQHDPPRRVTIEGDTAANGSTVTAAGTGIFITPAPALVAGDILQDEVTGEDLYIVSNTSGALVVGTRGAYQDNAVAPRALAPGTQLTIIGNAKEEFYTHGDPKSITPDMLYNFFQEQEEVISNSTWANAIDYYLKWGGDMREYQAIESMRRFKRKLENTCLFGNRLEGTTSGPNSLRLPKMGGLMYWIKAMGNIHDVGGAFTYSTFLDIMTDHARVGSGGQYAAFGCGFVGNIMRKWATPVASEKGFFTGRSPMFGLTYDQFGGPGWKVNFFQHESFEESDTRQQQLMIIKMDNNSRHYLRGNGLRTHKGIVSPEKDGAGYWMDQILANMTLKVKMPENNCLIQGITS